MKKLNMQQLSKVKGGAFSSTILNSITKAVSTVFSLGQAVGSALRRFRTGNYC